VGIKPNVAIHFSLVLDAISKLFFGWLELDGHQGGITCGAIEDPRKSSKAIDERVIINFRDKNVVIARFRDKNVVIVISVLSIAFLFYKYGKYI